MTDLLTLLKDLRDGSTDADTCAQARQLVQHDARLPEDVRAVALTDDVRAEAVALLGLLGHEPLGLRAAIESEAGSVQVALEDAWSSLGAHLAPAIEAEAGRVQVALDDDWTEVGAHLVAAIEAEAGRVQVALDDAWAAMAAQLVAAVRAEAGPVELADEVLFEIGLADDLIGAALAHEAGTIDIADGVLAAILSPASQPAVYVAPMPSVVAPEALAAPAAANNYRWWPALVALAAAALVAVFNLPSNQRAHEQFAFASADEIVVDALDYDDDAIVSVFQGADENAPLIIWVDDSEAM